MIPTEDRAALVARVREELASLAHEQWAGWMRHLFSKCISNGAVGILISREWADRWHWQVETPYEQLSDTEQNSDRAEADRILAVMEPLLADHARLQEARAKTTEAENVRLIQERDAGLNEFDHIYRRMAQERDKEMARKNTSHGRCVKCGHLVFSGHMTVENRENSPVWHTWCYVRAQKERADELESHLSQLALIVQEMSQWVEATCSMNCDSESSCRCRAHHHYRKCVDTLDAIRRGQPAEPKG